jgi:hypothetical protein
VTLAGTSDHTISVSWATANNTAVTTLDYISGNGTLNFAAGETSKTLTVLVLGDTVSELTETFFVNLTSPSSGFADARASAPSSTPTRLPSRSAMRP